MVSKREVNYLYTCISVCVCDQYLRLLNPEALISPILQYYCDILAICNILLPLYLVKLLDACVIRTRNTTYTDIFSYCYQMSTEFNKNLSRLPPGS